ncbi:MAG TPA: dephospho-CoA kinase [Synergistales bacterium]|jgi:dephospho-CoA kinase|nr:dephospho-CoA kinase [Synergistales bacterium]HPE91688.1 dephospho-CoA kinase [Synergistales bacterium]
MLVVGLTGDVGAGKSTVSSVWASLGAHVVSADTIVAALWKRNEMVELAAGRWGERILRPGMALDHSAISRIVFGDEKEYRWVCETIHPLVREEMERVVESLDGWIVAEIPLMFENGVPDWIDLTVYIEAPEDERVIRNASRGWDRDELRRRERWLLGSDRKKKMADLVLCNDGTREELEERARELGSRLLSLSSLVRVCFALGSSGASRRLFRELSRNGRVLEVEIAPGEECKWRDVFHVDPGLIVSAIVRPKDLEETRSMAARISGEGGPVCSILSGERRLPKEVLMRAVGSDKG